jgi:hypothetical protein
MVATLAACSDSTTVGQVAPDIATDPEAGTLLEFETYTLVRTREVQPQVVNVENRGRGVLSLTEVVIEGVDGSQYRVTQRPDRLSPGQIEPIFIRFEPETVGSLEAELVIRSNDRDTPEVRLPLVGLAREECDLSMRPEVLPFALGEERSIELVSRSSSSCFVTSIDTNSRFFELVDPPELPLEVGPFSTAQVRIIHSDTPLQAGVPTAQLVALEEESGRYTSLLTGEPPLFGCLRFSPPKNARILFGSVPLGQSSLETIRIENVCAEPIEVRGVAVNFNADEFGADPDQADGFIIPPTDDVRVGIRYTPEAAGDSLGRMVILTSDPAILSAEYDLVGSGAPPQIEVFPTELEFGEVTFRNPVGPEQRSECSSSARETFIFSVGNAPLEVRTIEVESEGDDLFLISSVLLENRNNAGDVLSSEPVADFTQPILVPPGQNLRVRMVYFPTRLDPAPHAATLRIEHSAEGGLERVRLFGESTPDLPVVDEFEQAPGPQVDLLWVIDNSCSMVDEQLRLIDNLGRFTQFADSQLADYQMAVTVTDGLGSDSGEFERCFPHPAIIKGTYAQRAAAFRCTFDVGTNGPFIEAGLAAAKNALTRTLNDVGLNTGFLREDAALAIVIMSDEDDGSVESNGLLKQFFRTVKGPGREDEVKVHAIAGPITEPCDNGAGLFAAQPGLRYKDVVDETGGLYFNICLDDWQPVLDELGLNTFIPRDTWILSKAADPTSIRVFVDGAEVLPGLSDGYTYDPAANSVTFTGAAVPGPGAEVEIRYLDLCTG